MCARALVVAACASLLMLPGGAAPAIPVSSEGEIAYTLMLQIQGVYDGTINDDGALEDDYDICVRDAGGGEHRRLSGLDPALPEYEVAPAWLPDGRRLGYLTRAGVVVSDLARGSRSLVPRTDEAASTPSFGPNDLVAFGTEARQIETVRLDGSGLTVIRSSAALEPSWSPDGARIVFVDHTGGIHLALMNPDGSNVVSLTPSGGVALSPAWSPDGTRIAFVARRGKSETIEVVKGDGSGRKTLKQIRDRSDHGSTLSWSPDGTRIAFVQDRPDQLGTDLYVIDADGSHVENLTDTPLDELAPAWRPADPGGGGRLSLQGPPCGLGGTPRDDVLTGSRWADYTEAIAGNDRIRTLGGRDVVYAGAGNDVVWAGDSVDLTFGEGGDDRIFGQGGRDIISGGNGNDRIVGGPGQDAIHGDAGDDVIFARDGERDGVHCGPGSDVVYADSADRLSRKTCEVILQPRG